MRNIEVGVQFTYNGKAFIGEVTRSQDAMNKFGKAGLQAGEEAAKGARQAANEAEKLNGTLQRVGHYAAAYLGVAQVLSFAKSLSEASLAADRLNNTLKFSTGSAQAGADALEYVRQTANRLGVDLASAGSSFAKFSAAAQGTSLSMRDTKAVFESVAKASVVLGLSAAESNGAMLALSQMMSKGTVQAEELRGQLGERIPGAFNIAARAMGVTTAELGKMLEQGQVISEDFLPKFAAEMERTFGAAAGDAANSAIANVNRLASAWEQFKRDLGQASNASGRPQWLIDGLNEASATMRTATADGHSLLGVLAAIGGFSFGAAGGGKISDDSVKHRLIAAQQELHALQDKPEFALDIGGKTRDLERIKELQQEIQGLFAQGSFKLPAVAELKAQAAAQTESIRKSLEESTRFSAAWAEAYQNQAQKKAEAIAKLDTLYAAESNKFRGKEEMQLKLAEGYATRRAVIEQNFKPKGADTQVKASNDFIAALEKETAAIGKNAYERKYLAVVAAMQSAATEGQRQTMIKDFSDWSMATQAEDANTEAKKANEAATKAAAKATEDAIKAEQEYMGAIGKETESLIDKAAAAELENAKIGMTTEQLAILTAKRYDEQIALKMAEADRMRGIGGREAELHLIEQQIAALGKLKNAEVTRPKLQAQADAWKNFGRDIESTLTDAISRGLEKGGRDGAQVALDVIKNTLRTIPIKIIAQAVVDPVMGGVRSVMQGGSFSSGMTGNIGQAYDMYNTGANLLGVGSLGNAGGIANTIGFATGGYTSAVGGMAGMAGSTPIMAGAAEGAAASGLMSGMATAMPYIAAALIAYQLLSGKDGPTPQHLGTTSANFSPTGEMLSATGGGASGMFRNAGSDAFVQGMQSQYAASIAALGGKAAGSSFFYGSGQQSDGTSAMRRIAGGASGGEFFNSGEIGASDAEVSLAASRAVFTALQGSELPGYLSKLFDGIAASSLSQDQINNTLAFAQSLKQLRDGLAETRTPLEIVTSQMTSLYTEFHTSATSFKTDFVAAIDAGITPATLARWQQLGAAIDQVTAKQEEAAQAAQRAADESLRATQSLFDTAKSNLLDRYNSESDAAQQLADKMRGFADGFARLKNTLSLGNLSPLGGYAKYQEAQRQFDDVSRRAQLGDTAAMGDLENVSQSFLQASRDYNASNAQYASDYDRVSRVLDTSSGVASRQADIANQQVGILRGQLDALGLINTGVVSLNDLLTNFLNSAAAVKTASGGYSKYAASDITAHFAAKPGISPQDAYNDIVAYSADPYAVGAAYGLDRTQTDAWFSDHGVQRVKGFASGGDHVGGLRIVGERGIELEATGPSRIFNADQTRQILSGGGDNKELLAEFKALRAEVVRLSALVAKQTDQVVDAVDNVATANAADLRGLKQTLSHNIARLAA